MGAVQFSMKTERRPREGISCPADHRRNELAPVCMKQEACQVVFLPESGTERKDDVKDARALFTEWKRIATQKLVIPNFEDKKTRADRPRCSCAAETGRRAVFSVETPGFAGDPLYVVVWKLALMFCLL